MFLKSLWLKNFRNIKTLNLKKITDFTIISGSNAQGKTNILESVFLLAHLRSFRTSNLSNCVSDNENEAFLGAENEKNQLRLAIKKGIKKSNLEVKLNHKKTITKKAKGIIKCVWFSPEEMNLLYFPPISRRKYLNLLLTQTDAKYKEALLDFSEILKQRNCLLGAIADNKAQKWELDFWNEKLVITGSYIVWVRKQFIDFINQGIERSYSAISKEKNIEGIRIELKTNIYNNINASNIDQQEIFNNYQKRIISQIPEDIRFRSTKYGPHKDDFDFVNKGNRSLDSFASRGEMRSALLALKLGETVYLEKTTGEKPILLLDDVFSELDEKRRKSIEPAIFSHQSILTTTDLTFLPTKLKKQSQIYITKEGILSKQ